MQQANSIPENEAEMRIKAVSGLDERVSL